MPDVVRHISERSEDSFHCFKAGSPGICVGFPTLKDIRNSLGEMRTLLESTDHVLAEYIQIQKMESVEYLARELGHDLRNGLMALAAKLFQLQRAFPNDEMERRVEDINGVLKNLEEMISRLQSLGQDEHAQDDFVFFDLIRETPKAIRHMESLLDTKMRIEFLSGPGPLHVMLCRGDVWRILSNLLLNARDAMPRGGRVLVQVAEYRIDAEYCRNHGNAHPGQFAGLSVEDEGIGISPEALPKIFDPLFSTKSSSQDAQKRGWGLAIVYTLVRRRGGWIDVESKLNEGTRFQVFLPVYQASQSS